MGDKQITNFVGEGDDEDDDMDARSKRSGTVSGSDGKSTVRNRQSRSFSIFGRGKEKKPEEIQPGTKNAVRKISDVVECRLEPSMGPHAFSIMYAEKRIMYESRWADEIVDKVSV